ncbi:MAG: LytTR family DNA-binding domain-containing protein [Erysipelotrichaceae bacterium]|nr:LytTR family DNA-binding domain-containing protein [Erysipelotrichaceae bacterium]MDY5252870.1 LytTR family DNA-binding domain-containing protein [Erysipelotrichaceae bacterium]
MINIAICDDNQNDLDNIVKVLSGIELKFNIHQYLTPQQLLSDINNGIIFDAFLLDILMNEENGIDLARHIRKTHQTTPIFFITATPEFALQGYEVNALRYYLKPLDIPKLSLDLYNILKNVEQRKNSYITLTNTKGLFKLRINDIYYIESMLRTIKIHTKNDSFTAIGKISDFEETLKNNNFVRVHKSFLVNLAYIKNIYKDTITLDNDTEVLLSKHRSKEIHLRLLNYVKENV